MVVAAGVDATRNIEFDIADVMLEIQIVEALCNRGRNRNRFCIRQCAEVAAGAANDVGQQSNVGGGQSL